MKYGKNKPETNELVVGENDIGKEIEENKCFCEYKFLHSFDLTKVLMIYNTEK